MRTSHVEFLSLNVITKDLDRPLPPPIQPGGVLRAAAARVDLTPELRSPLAGWGPKLPGTRRMRGTYGRLFASALVLDDGRGERVALVTADLHAGARYIAEHVAERLAAAPNCLHIGRLLLAGTHTHSGPGNMYGSVFYDAFASGELNGGLDGTWVDYCVERIAEAVRSACQQLAPARVGSGVARLWGWTRNRSLPAFLRNHPGLDELGVRAALRDLAFPDEPGGTLPAGLLLEHVALDPRLQCIWAEEVDARGAAVRPIGAFATFAMHGTMVPREMEVVSPDVLGWAARRAEQRVHAAWPVWTGRPHTDGAGPVMGLASGAIGDVDPQPPGTTLDQLRELRRSPEDVYRLVDEVGRALGDAFVAACTDARQRATTSLSLSPIYAEPEVRDARTTDGRKLALNARVGASMFAGSELGRGAPCFSEGLVDTSQPESDPHWPKAIPRELNPIADLYLRYQAPLLPLRIIKIGDAWVCGVPGEPTSWLSHQLERALRGAGAQRVLVAGVCGDYAGYLTTPAEYEAQHYEGASTLWGRFTGQWLVEQYAALAGGAPSAPTEKARFTFHPGQHATFTSPAPPGPEATPVWPRPARIDRALCDANGRLQLEGRWFAWAPQEERELGRRAWVTIHVFDGAVFRPFVWQGREVNDREFPFLLQTERRGDLVLYTWRVMLDEASPLSGQVVSFRVVGPRGVTVRPGAGETWPALRIVAPPRERGLEAPPVAVAGTPALPARRAPPAAMNLRPEQDPYAELLRRVDEAPETLSTWGAEDLLAFLGDDASAQRALIQAERMARARPEEIPAGLRDIPLVQGKYRPRTLDELQRLVAHGRTAGASVRVEGAGHSYREAVHGTGSQDLRLVLDGDFRAIQLLSTGVEDGEAFARVRVGGGCYMGHNPSDPTSTDSNSLSGRLEGWSRALPITGGITHQSIAGFLQTGSAGGSLVHGFADTIESFELLDGRGRLHTYQRGEDRFDAAGVAMGLMGVITSVTLRVPPTYLVEGHEENVEFADSLVAQDAVKPARLADALREVEYLHLNWFPQRYVHRVMQWIGHRVPMNGDVKPYKNLLRDKMTAVLAALALKIASGALHVDPESDSVQRLVGFILQRFLPIERRTFRDLWSRALPSDDQVDVDRVIKTYFTEVWLPVERTDEVLGILSRLWEDQAVAGNFAMELYGAKGSPFWLSPAYARDVVRVDPYWWAYSFGDARTHFTPYWNELLSCEGARLHWGKYLPLPGQHCGKIFFGQDFLRARYPRFDDWRMLRKELDPEGVFMTPYWAGVLGA